MLLNCILIFTLLSLSLCKLLYVSTTFRHGARYPLSNNYDIYDSNQTRAFSGVLTTVGIRQLYLLGNYLKADYIDRQKIINSTLFAKQFEMFSDTSARCIQSGIAFASGLFPLQTGAMLPDGLSQQYLRPPFEQLSEQNLRSQAQKWSSVDQNGEYALKMGFQPIPYTTPTYYFRCSRQMDFVNKRFEAEKIRLALFQQSQAAYIERLKTIFNLKPQYTTLIGLTDVFDVIICDMFLGRKLPETFTNSDFKQINFIQAYLYALIYSDILGQVFATPLMNHVLMNMDDTIKRGKDQVKRFSVFSAHDTNIVPLLTFLNLTSADCIEKQWKNQTYSGNCAEVVPFASNIIFELHESDNSPGTHYVKVKYNGQYFNLCEKSITQCNYQDFAARVRRNLIDFEKQCPISKSGNQTKIYEVDIRVDEQAVFS